MGCLRHNASRRDTFRPRVTEREPSWRAFRLDDMREECASALAGRGDWWRMRPETT